MVWLNKIEYEGQWVNGCREGQGQMTLEGGDKYVGKWKADMYEG